MAKKVIKQFTVTAIGAMVVCAAIKVIFVSTLRFVMYG
jgi:hypothetical protein